MRSSQLAPLLAAAVVACQHAAPAPVPSAPPPQGSADDRPASARLTARPRGSTTAPGGFYEYLPPGYGDGQPRPLLVSLHGMMENGDGAAELKRVLRNGIPKLLAIDAWPAARPFVVLAPQHQGVGCPTGAEVHAFLSWAMSAYRIDPRRVYLTGLSCGAAGAWSYLADQGGGVVAAALLAAGDPGVPATASSAWARRGCGLAEVAIWAVHGSKDAVVPIAAARTTLEKLAACPSPPARAPVFTEVMPAHGGPQDGHDVWTALYGGSWQPDPYAWLLAQSRP